MRSSPEIFEVRADQCTRMAEAAHDKRLKRLFADLASQWRELAATARSLQADAKVREEFSFYAADLSPMSFRILAEISAKSLI